MMLTILIIIPEIEITFKVRKKVNKKFSVLKKFGVANPVNNSIINTYAQIVPLFSDILNNLLS